MTQTVNDNGLSEILSTTFGASAVGSFILTITPLSDTGVLGIAFNKPITIPGAPIAPGVPIYISGDCTATVISFATSSTVGATYNIYLPQEIGGPTFVESAAQTHAAGSGTISMTLNAFSVAAGSITVFVTSVNGGIESAYQKVTITYQSDGTVATPAANVPTVAFQRTPVDSGRNIEVAYRYDSSGQAAVPAKVQTRTLKQGAVSPVVQSAVNISSIVGNIATGTLTIASGSDGWFLISIRSVTTGIINSAWSNWIGPVWCSNVTMGAVSGVTTNIVA